MHSINYTDTILLLAEDIKKKCKNIRDNYTREINETRNVASGSEASKSKKNKYSYAEVLSFLQPVVQKRK